MKHYSLTVDYIVEMPDDVDFQELKLDFVDVLIETVEAHKGTLSGTLNMIKN